jgi:polynucleotide 5'-hydroxyl-kinase GRC3/NOL9
VADTIVPPQWLDLGHEDLCGTIMVIGESDTGKSTLARYLYQHHCRQGRRVAYLDADIGQSTLGVPTTLNLAVVGEPGNDSFPPQGPRAVFFVGATTPRGHMLPTVIGTYQLQQRALALGADVVVVDTTGLVDKAQGGKALKQWKIELLAPRVVISLQRRRELEPILWPLRRDPRVRCVELAVSPYVLQRSRGTRIARRRERLSQYFHGAQVRPVSLGQVATYDLELLAVGAILAFQDGDGLTLGLGVIEKVDGPGGTVMVRTPLENLQGVTSVRIGSARWEPNDKEENAKR